MSKAVKSVGKAVKGVVKGVAKVAKAATTVARGVVKGVGKLVSRVAKSDIGKALLIAATIYFGGAAFMGAMGGAAAGSGFMGTIAGAVKGAGAGITSAWGGLTSAATAFMGGNMAGAGSALSQGFMGANAAGGAAVAGAAPLAGAASTAATSFANPGLLQAANIPGAAGAAGGAASGGLLSGLSPMAQYGLIQSGSQLVGGMMQGAAADKQYQEELRQEELARQRRNENIGAQIIRPADEMGDYPTIQEREEMRRIDPITGQPILAGSPRQVGLIGGAFQPHPMLSSLNHIYNPMRG